MKLRFEEDDLRDRLFVGVLGNRNSGKSSTWYKLFGRKVKTGTKAKRLELFGGESVDVFLVNGSFEERGKYAGDTLDPQTCRIVLCSIQYIEEARSTLNYVVQEGFDTYIQWLNPGYNDAGESFDRLGLVSWLVGHNATFCLRDGQQDETPRSEEIRQFIYGWAKARHLTVASS